MADHDDVRRLCHKMASQLTVRDPDNVREREAVAYAYDFLMDPPAELISSVLDYLEAHPLATTIDALVAVFLGRTLRLLRKQLILEDIRAVD
jgi:hypothetical protein